VEIIAGHRPVPGEVPTHGAMMVSARPRAHHERRGR
jgi:hypothetical protein